jgi:nucleoside-diphosphate-sugar epimerase
MDQTILVTGGSGKLGRSVVSDLQEHGYRVVNADRHLSDACRTMRVDLCALGQVYGAMAGCDAVVHLAAIPAPNADPPEIVFGNNVISTFNVLQAASVLGIKKVVLASSLSALGLAYKVRPVPLRYFPIDEAHPALAQDAYGLSKIVGEEVAEGFARRDDDMSLVSLRLPLLVAPEEFLTMIRRLQQNMERTASVLWSYLDTRDAAYVIRQALEYEGKGHEVFYVNAPDTFVNVPTLELLREHYPAVEADPAKLEGYASPIDCSRACEILGFAPQFGWRNAMTDHAEEQHVV